MKTAMLAVAAVVLGGCTVRHESLGPVQHETTSIELDKSEMVRVELAMGAGELRVNGGTPKLMEADFEYNDPTWKPVVHYDASSFRSTLTVQEPSGAGGSGTNYKWDLRLNNGLPMDFSTHLGAGEARMNLGTLSLRSVEINMGVGNLDLDLRGDPKRDYNVQIHGGVGNATVYLPSNVGVEAEASGGIGDIKARGLEKRNDRWINPAHEHGPVTIRMKIAGGVGNITLIAE